jgi:hypothetical protein
MRHGLVVGLAFVGGCHSGTTAPTHPPERTSTVALVSELETLRFYLGDWDCDVRVFDEHDKVSQQVKLAVRVRPELAGRWLKINVIESGRAVTSELKGYDAPGKRFRHLWVADTGESGTLSSPGWDGDQMVFVDDPAPPGAKWRMTFVKRSETAYTHRAETDAGSGYRVAFEKSCRKRAGS